MEYRLPSCSNAKNTAGGLYSFLRLTFGWAFGNTTPAALRITLILDTLTLFRSASIPIIAR